MHHLYVLYLISFLLFSCNAEDISNLRSGEEAKSEGERESNSALALACSETPSFNYTTYEYINAVTINGTNIRSGDNRGYADHSDNPVNVIGDTLTVEIAAGFPKGTWTEGYSVWVDLDQDGSLDDETPLTMKTRDSYVDFTLALPDTLRNGNIKMRIGMRYNSIPSICEDNIYGEYEDFVLAFERPVANLAILEPANEVISVLTATSFNWSWEAVQGANSYFTEIINADYGDSRLLFTNSTQLTPLPTQNGAFFSLAVTALDANGNVLARGRRDYQLRIDIPDRNRLTCNAYFNAQGSRDKYSGDPHTCNLETTFHYFDGTEETIQFNCII